MLKAFENTIRNDVLRGPELCAKEHKAFLTSRDKIYVAWNIFSGLGPCACRVEGMSSSENTDTCASIGVSHYFMINNLFCRISVLPITRTKYTPAGTFCLTLLSPLQNT